MRWAEPTAARVQHIAERVRYQDELELLYGFGLSGKEGVLQSWKNSAICRCIDADDGSPVGICGLNGTKIWLLGTEKLLATPSHRRQFIRGGKLWIHGLMADGHRYLENWALASNFATLRWLQHLGFTIDTPEPRGRSAQLFCHFWRAA